MIPLAKVVMEVMLIMPLDTLKNIKLLWSKTTVIQLQMEFVKKVNSLVMLEFRIIQQLHQDQRIS